MSTWAHATNTSELLDACLQSKIAYIEVDVCMNIPNQCAVMRHSFESYLNDVRHEMTSREWIERIGSNDHSWIKCLKFDFKNLDCVSEIVTLLAKHISSHVEIWINADVIGDKFEHSALERFILAVRGKKIIFSLGWVTKFNICGVNIYSEEEILQMKSFCEKYGITDNVTFAVRACHFMNSIESFRKILLPSFVNRSNVSFTVWSGDEGLPSYAAEELEKRHDDLCLQPLDTKEPNWVYSLWFLLHERRQPC